MAASESHAYDEDDGPSISGKSLSNKSVSDFVDDIDDEFELIPNSVNGVENGSESVLFSNIYKDRRDRIVTGTDNRQIIQCIGKIKTAWKSDGEFSHCGTGTVFKYDKYLNNCFVLTCAHNVTHWKRGDASRLAFTRIKTLPPIDRKSGSNSNSVMKKFFHNRDKNNKNNKHRKSEKNIKCYIEEVQQYDILKWSYFDKYHVKTANDHSEHDLAILLFYDKDNFYGEFFSNNNNTIELFPCEQVPTNFRLTYGLYGYPVSKDKNSKVKQQGPGLYGMAAKSTDIILVRKASHRRSSNTARKHSHSATSHEDESTQSTKQHVSIKYNKTTGLFEYDAIDTEPGQSGGALFVELNDEKVGIVGVHTGGSCSYKEVSNWAVALTSDKIKWLNQKFVVEHFYSQIIDWQWSYTTKIIKQFPSKTITCDKKSCKQLPSSSIICKCFTTCAKNPMTSNSGIYQIKFKIDDVGKDCKFLIGISDKPEGVLAKLSEHVPLIKYPDDLSPQASTGSLDENKYSTVPNGKTSINSTGSIESTSNVPRASTPSLSAILVSSGDSAAAVHAAWDSSGSAFFDRDSSDLKFIGNTNAGSADYIDCNYNYVRKHSQANSSQIMQTIVQDEKKDAASDEEAQLALPPLTKGDVIILEYNSNAHVLRFKTVHDGDDAKDDNDDTDVDEENREIEGTLCGQLSGLPKNTTFYWVTQHRRGEGMSISILK